MSVWSRRPRPRDRPHSRSRTGSHLGSPHARSRDRLHRPLAHRPRQQGLAQGPSSRRPGCNDHPGRAGQGARAGPFDDRRPLPRLRPARRRVRLQHGPHRQRPAGLRRHPRRHDHPLLLLLGADHPDGVPRDQGRRGRRRSSRPGVETVSRFVKGTSDHWPDTQNPLFDDAAAPHRRVRRGWPGLARPARGRPAPRRLHRDGPDRRERRPAARPGPQGARRVRRPLAEPRREGDRRRLLGTRDHPGHHARRHRGQQPTTARAPASPTTRLTELQAGLPPRRRRHRRQLLRAQRRRRGRGHHVRHQGRRARPHAAGPDRLHRRQRPVPRDHGPRSGRGDQAGPGQRRDDHRRHRPGRDQRGVRGAGRAVLPGPRHRPRPAQRQRRRHRGRPPVRHDRRPAPEHDDQLAGLPRQDHRPDHHVRRRRSGHGADPRAASERRCSVSRGDAVARRPPAAFVACLGDGHDPALRPPRRGPAPRLRHLTGRVRDPRAALRAPRLDADGRPRRRAGAQPQPGDPHRHPDGEGRAGRAAHAPPTTAAASSRA